MKQTELESVHNPQISSSLQTSQNCNSKITLVSALSRLKETQDRIYQAKKRLQIMQMRQTSHDNKIMERSRVERYHKKVRQFAQGQKSLKNKMLVNKSVAIEMNRNKSIEQRRKHKEKIRQIKQVMIKEKRQRYLQSKKQKQQMKQVINKNKNDNLSQRRTNYSRMYQEENKRKQYLKNYLKNKQLEARLQKEQQTMVVQSRIQENCKLLDNLQKAGSEASNSNISPQDRSINGNGEGSVKNFAQKSFRVKYYKNQTSILLE